MAGKALKNGIFVTLEGPEGSGKSTHSKLLYEYLNKKFKCISAREPGGTKVGEAIREMLLHSDGMKISDIAELFLFEAARAQLTEEIIKPALKKNLIVICDRFYDATTSYQGYGGKVSLKIIERLNMIAAKNLRPDLTILLDLETVAGLNRAKKKGQDRMERKDVAYHKRVRNGYLRLAKREPDRIKVVEVADSIEETQELVRKHVDLLIERRGTRDERRKNVIQRYKRAKQRP